MEGEGSINGTTVFGVASLTFMMVMYVMEHRDPRFIPGFAFGCALSSLYGFLAGAWPFGVLEAIWCMIAMSRFLSWRRVSRTGTVPD